MAHHAPIVLHIGRIVSKDSFFWPRDRTPTLSPSIGETGLETFSASARILRE